MGSLERVLGMVHGRRKARERERLGLEGRGDGNGVVEEEEEGGGSVTTMQRWCRFRSRGYDGLYDQFL